LVHGSSLFLRDSIIKNYSAIVVFPLYSNESYWSNVQATTSSERNSKRTFFFVPDGPASVAVTMLMSLTGHLLLQYPEATSQAYAMGL